jgi:BirA family biotin operon repressor/biotin-[acetyl-CoA-carboxylase] ligase
MPLPVLRLLSHDEYRSGEEIARRLSMTRASVNNAVREAERLGVAIDAVRGRGYRLGCRYDWLDGARLQRDGAALGYDIGVHDRLASTNSHLLVLAQQGAAHKQVVAAEMQHAGRGRRGRTWHAQLGRGLTFSVLWRFQRPLTALSGMSLVVGLALARCLRGLGAEAWVKWPNDVLLGSGKLAGILIETQGDVLSGATAVIGIGVNLAVGDELAERAGAPVASLADVLPSLPERNDLLLAILAELDADLRRFDAEGFAPFAAPWTRLHAHQGRAVTILSADGRARPGRALGVDAQGALLLETEAGVATIHSGEVSLRPC